MYFLHTSQFLVFRLCDAIGEGFALGTITDRLRPFRRGRGGWFFPLRAGGFFDHRVGVSDADNAESVTGAGGVESSGDAEVAEVEADHAGADGEGAGEVGDSDDVIDVGCEKGCQGIGLGGAVTGTAAASGGAGGGGGDVA